MGVNDAPPWLGADFTRTAREAGASAPAAAVDLAAARLLDRWCDPRRRFHNIRHLVGVLTRVDELAAETHAPALVRLAAFYHGAVFDSPLPAPGRPGADHRLPGRQTAGHGAAEPEGAVACAAALEVPPGANWENEAASAEVAREELAGLGIDSAAVERVATLIRTLADQRALPKDTDSAVLTDAALGMLAVEPQRYEEYVRAVRAENETVPAAAFFEARISAIEGLLERPALFGSPGAKAWERSARDNLSAELNRDRKALVKADLDAECKARAAADPG
ncbi:MAG: hypothetical protein LBT54_01895 [Bifidobacteriaceae bacterium]|jgi:predicted metal-dependent HD superfamily phosphohydrolase|nr:hypothetical protein [Bifidobacteriaceae bacterium]